MKAIDPAVRFSQKYVVDEDGCWIWQGHLHKRGYGHLKVYGQMVRAHRWAYEYFIGPIPKGYDIDHTCHSNSPVCEESICKHRSCVNPQHLDAVSRQEHGLRSIHSKKTHCVRGHEYTPDNTLMREGGRKRACRKCAVIASQKYRLSIGEKVY